MQMSIVTNEWTLNLITKHLSRARAWFHAQFGIIQKGKTGMRMPSIFVPEDHRRIQSIYRLEKATTLGMSTL